MRSNSFLKSESFHSHCRVFFFFLAVIFYQELLLQVLTGWMLTFARFFIVLFFTMCYSSLVCAVAELLSSWRGKRTVICLLLTILGILFATQYFLYTSYQTYMTLDSILTGGGNVAAEFKGIVFQLIFRRFWVIVLFLLPVLLYALFGKARRAFGPRTVVYTIICVVLAVVCFGLGSLIVNLSPDKLRYKEEYSFDAACHTFGLLTGCRLNIRYSGNQNQQIAFQLQESNDDLTEEPDETISGTPNETSPETPNTTSEKRYHKLDIDFAALAEETSNASIAELHSYVATLRPDRTNAYTGLFKGKNLILITAEAFSKEVIDPVRTPTLYRLANKGIVFEDYYQPAWGGSTSTGEYSNFTGLVPTNGVRSILDTVGHNMYFTLGNQLQRQNYFSAAYHNNTYTYYDRDKTHQNMGYSTFLGLGNGMEEGVASCWPESDLEMIDFTVPQYIDKQPFSIYYMTVSGHGNYNQQGNAMSKKNYEVVADMDVPDAVRCYYSANMELEYAMASLVKQLEEAGIADDTVIVLSTDHYPYALEKSDAWGTSQNYLIDLYGYDPILNTQQDHSALIIWSGCLEKESPIVVKDPVYSLDIVPTLSNLFGLEYDSRLLVGRDVFSNQSPLVIWPDYSWLTEQGYYSTSFGTFTPAEGASVTDDYVSRIKAIVANKISFSRGVLAYDYYSTLFGEDDVK